LVSRLVAEEMPLTVCPFSNVKLRVVPELRKHMVGQMLRRGLCVSINSDDPPYFGGYIGDNYIGTARALDLGLDDMVRVARNSFSSSFLPDADKERHIHAVNAYAAKVGAP
jgi:adenosine deaminase